MNATVKSLIFWVVLIVVGVGIWKYSSTFERIETERIAAAQPAAAPAEQSATDPEAKLKELGIVLPAPGAPTASYVNAVQTGNLLFLAGKGPLQQDGKDVVGRLGKDMTVEQGYQAARSVAIAHLAVLKKELGDLKRVTRIVKVLGMVNSDPAFTQQPAVVNGYSDLMVAVFGDKGKHARSAVGMAALPSGIPVEVEVIVEIGPVR
jgi:enamine deaminase RidA (YjgF/YER057c/UK114 family)